MERWTQEQLQASVDAYLAMREQMAIGESVNKAQTYRDLADAHGKSAGAWEQRFGNVSQVMEQLGYRLIPGLKPLPNVGSNVTKVLAGMIQKRIGDGEAGLADNTVRAELVDAEHALEATGGFAPAEAKDERRWVMKSVVQRRGQPAFRKALIEAYSGKCAISGCAIVDILEAAHIFPFMDGSTNDVGNGLLLRADLHTLFDLHLISFDPDSLRVVAKDSLRGSEYEMFFDRVLATRATGSPGLATDALRWHRSQCNW